MFTAILIALKARSHDLILRIRLFVPKIGSRRSDGLISRFRFCGENVGRSFVVCSHDPIFRANKESSIWHQNVLSQGYHAKFVGTFRLSGRMSDENRACSISIRFFSKLRIRVSEGHFQCVHTIRFSEPTKIRSLKTDRVNGHLQ